MDSRPRLDTRERLYVRVRYGQIGAIRTDEVMSFVTSLEKLMSPARVSGDPIITRVVPLTRTHTRTYTKGDDRL